MKTPELLLPVGNMPMAIAAIHGGADALYVGVPGFNARGRSYDFSLGELRELIELAHLYGVKVHLAFNVLVFENELAIAEKILRELIPLGPDAFIVQDIGLIRLIRLLAPSMRIHGSTQMTVTNHEAITLLDDLGIQRFVLGRENSINEIQLIREGTQRELEVFVHGALCVAYSGQCFTSESLGGRSANRGQCAQSCRLGYEMFVDGQKLELGEKRYLVSPQDLCALDDVPALIAAGVDSFKVEGRLKGPEYVALAAQSYRAAIAGQDYHELRTNLATSYSRGFFSGWLHGVDHQRLVEGSFSAHRGVEIGQVHKVLADAVVLEAETDLVAGMGLLFAQGGKEVGGKVFSATRLAGKKWQVKLLAPFDLQQVKATYRVWINSDDRIKQQVKKLSSDRDHVRRVPLSMELDFCFPDAVVLRVHDFQGHSIELKGPAGQLPQKELKSEVYWQELGALSHTPYELKEKKISGSCLYLPSKVLRHLRNEAMAMITQKRIAPALIEVMPQLAKAREPRQTTSKTQLNLMLRSKAQVQDLLEMSFDREVMGTIILDYEFGKDYSESVRLLRSAGFKTGIATTRILKPKEYYNLNAILRCEPDAIWVRNLGALNYLQGKTPDLRGDFSLNVTNHLTAEYLLSKGLESVCASYDLNRTQLESLLKEMDASQLEITMHQYMPEFHMEHCVFAAFLSKGSSFKDCGKPCELHSVELKDTYGHMHFLKADQECRNTLYRASAQSAAFLTQAWQQAPGFWRCETLEERGGVLAAKLTGYLELIQGRKSLSDVLQQVGTLEKYGVTEGQLSVNEAWQDRKKGSENHFA